MAVRGMQAIQQRYPIWHVFDQIAADVYDLCASGGAAHGNDSCFGPSAR